MIFMILFCFHLFSHPIANLVDLNGNEAVDVDDDDEDDVEGDEVQAERDVWRNANPSGRVNPRYEQPGYEGTR